MSCFQRLNLLLLLGVNFGAAVCLSLSRPSLAQKLSVPQPSAAPLQLSLLKSPGQPDNSDRCDPTVVTANTICQQQLTVPSLWWAKEQFGSQLLDNWLAYPANDTTAARVDLIVNRQVWSLLDYIQRYEFVNKFGNVAQDYGYNIRVFNYQKELLATYTCNFNTTPQQCNLQLDTSSLASGQGAN